MDVSLIELNHDRAVRDPRLALGKFTMTILAAITQPERTFIKVLIEHQK